MSEAPQGEAAHQQPNLLEQQKPLRRPLQPFPDKLEPCPFVAAAQLPFFKTRCLGNILYLPRAEHDVITIGEQHERFASSALRARVPNAVDSLLAMPERVRNHSVTTCVGT
jgi:hypothetical protein